MLVFRDFKISDLAGIFKGKKGGEINTIQDACQTTASETTCVSFHVIYF